MSIPMQVSMPLALHLRTEITYNFFSNQRWKPGEMYQEKRSAADFRFIDQQSGRFTATVQFATILRTVYYHPDWSQIHAFCTKRYSQLDLSNRDNRKLRPSSSTFSFSSAKSPTVNFNTDPSTIGLPRDLIEQITNATRKAISGMMGPDPLNCSIGPAIGCAIGAGAYMDLIYEGNLPGTPPPPRKQRISTTAKRGGRGSSPAEWRDLWAAIGDWIYENESASINTFGGTHSYKYRLSDEEMAEYGFKLTRKHLQTNAIRGADAIRDMFGQLAEDPTKFQGIEWDFLELEADNDVEKAFLVRFGPKPSDEKMREDLARDASRGPVSHYAQSYSDVNPHLLRPCPESSKGVDWENWMLSIEGGTIVKVDTIFQALWAVMLLSYLPLHIKILDKLDTYPQFPNPEFVYI